MTIRCVIVDDEAPARDELRYLLGSHDRIEIVGEAATAAQAIQLCLDCEPDLVFLDIQLPGEDGFEVIRAVTPQLDATPLFVFVTAYDSYAVKAFEESAVDYILKPVEEKRLATTLERASRLLADKGAPLREQIETLLSQVTRPTSAQKHTKVSVEKNGRIRLLDPADIIYCSYEDQKIVAHTYDEVVPIYGIASMDRMEDHLDGASFFRAHRATLVNLDAIREFSPWFNGKYSLIMADQMRSELTVSRTRVKDFKHRLGL
ncbi:two component transcriptional regulator, LytTR family [Cohaesibacter sp. ES.047]|uniref:LytR/AlgR family response regulator transcription factor n=1 Tax=Cohaesibacter sp. ES.047 TaxID=1798205 RepID=UPI000BB9A74A|nr:LytTR family DNA-binding domain-containing protein [Cohaesibacter sp. ES.047]SNY90002.1 two component transcriptional regulator, LytTR family [Cohaesibacter sp. ES.047]